MGDAGVPRPRPGKGKEGVDPTLLYSDSEEEEEYEEEDEEKEPVAATNPIPEPQQLVDNILALLARTPEIEPTSVPGPASTAGGDIHSPGASVAVAVSSQAIMHDPATPPTNAAGPSTLMPPPATPARRTGQKSLPANIERYLAANLENTTKTLDILTDNDDRPFFRQHDLAYPDNHKDNIKHWWKYRAYKLPAQGAFNKERREKCRLVYNEEFGEALEEMEKVVAEVQKNKKTNERFTQIEKEAVLLAYGARIVHDWSEKVFVMYTDEELAELDGGKELLI